MVVPTFSTEKSVKPRPFWPRHRPGAGVAIARGARHVSGAGLTEAARLLTHVEGGEVEDLGSNLVTTVFSWILDVFLLFCVRCFCSDFLSFIFFMVFFLLWISI